MSRSPSKRKSTPARAPSHTLRNRLALAVAVIAIGGILVWRPWSAHHGPRPETVALAPIPTPPPSPAPAAPVAGPGSIAAILASPAPAPASAPAPAPTPANAHMTASQEAAFDAWLIGVYKQCWAPPRSLPEGEPYFPRVRVAFKSDGGLAGPPKLVNPPDDPAWRPHAEAALRAVKSCDPLHVPEKYAPYYLQWKTKTVYFDTARS